MIWVELLYDYLGATGTSKLCDTYITFTLIKNLSEKPEIHAHNMILLQVELKLSSWIGEWLEWYNSKVFCLSDRISLALTQLHKSCDCAALVLVGVWDVLVPHRAARCLLSSRTHFSVVFFEENWWLSVKWNRA